MHEHISVNGNIDRVASELFGFASSSMLYGKGIFTTVRILDRDPSLWSLHWRRLSENSAKLGLDLCDHTEQVTRDALDGLLESNAVVNGRARITFLDESAGDVWRFETGRKTSLLIMTGDLRPPATDLRLTVSPYGINSRSPLAGIKSCNYMEKIMALDEAKSRGFDEAVQTDERGNISSACMANLFWLAGGELFTPALSTGCLPGTTREFILEKAECREVEVGIDSLAGAESIFLTSAGIGVARVSEFARRVLPPADHPILSLIN